MQWIGKDILSNTNAYACNYMVFTLIHGVNTKGDLNYSILSMNNCGKDYTFTECKDEMSTKGYLTKHQYWKWQSYFGDENQKYLGENL